MYLSSEISGNLSKITEYPKHKNIQKIKKIHEKWNKPQKYEKNASKQMIARGKKLKWIDLPKVNIKHGNSHHNRQRNQHHCE